MKVVIMPEVLARALVEETETKPKPMIEIGGRPMIWHIMKIYSCGGSTSSSFAFGWQRLHGEGIFRELPSPVRYCRRHCEEYDHICGV